MTKIEFKKLVFETLHDMLKEQPAPVMDPPTKPATPVRTPAAPPAPSKPSRPNPLKPTRPGISPKPKALSHDIQAFIRQRSEMNEAIDIGDYPDYIDPSKRSSVENEKEYVEQIFPDLGPEADRYLEIITSESYRQSITKLARYLNLNIEQLQEDFPTLPSLVTLVFKALEKIKRIEHSRKSELSKLAVETVLGLDEYKHIKKLVESGDLIIDAKLAPADLTKSITADKLDQQMKNGLTVAENLNVQINQVMLGNSEGKLKRTLANFMTQGSAVNKFYLFNLVSDKLKIIDPTLINQYGILCSITQILYYALPNVPLTSAIVNNTAVGSEEVIPTGDKYTIKARAVTFPYLIHELDKGINDYLTMDIASDDELGTETIDQETKQMMAGPALDHNLRKLIPTDKIEYLPVIKKYMLRLPVAQIKDILSGGGKAHNLMNTLIKKAENDMSDYNSED